MFGVGYWCPLTEEFMENGGCEAPAIPDKYEASFPINFVNYAQNKIAFNMQNTQHRLLIICSTIQFPYHIFYYK